MTTLPLLARSFGKLACGAAMAVFSLSAAPIIAEEPTLQLKDHDVWVMAGDSITAQRLHTSYIEAFYRTRYPKLNLHFRSSGITGNKASNVLARFDYDVAAWKPTIVSIELGMNDAAGLEADYVKGIRQLIAKIRAIPAQPVLFSPSPVDDGSTMNDWRSVRCEKLHAFTEALKKVAEDEKVVFVDQYHPLLELWGKNRRLGAEAAAKQAATQPPVPATPVPATPGATPAPPNDPPIPSSLIPLGGDKVHIGPVGQYTMAAVLLAGLKADGEVSSATLTADGKVVEAKRCQITNASVAGGKLSFTRLDEVGPWPIFPSSSAKAVLDLYPDMLKLSQYLLRVTGLPDGPYRVNIDGKPAGTITAKQLADGWNLSTSFDSAIGEHSKVIHGLILKLQIELNNKWRLASKEKNAEALEAAQKEIEACEAELQAAVQPKPLLFEIEK